MPVVQAAGRAAPLNTRARQLFAAALIVLALDQAVKTVVVARMVEGQTVPVVDGILHWTFVRNPGAAFSLFDQVPWLFTILASLIAIWIIRNAPAVPTRGQALAYGAILGGALGNLTDRFLRDPAPFRGYVIDMIDLRIWPVFNVADMGVVLGAGTLVWLSWRAERAARDPLGSDAPPSDRGET